jgi:3-carboxy-cis,cis-muconate cycloisomerase
LPESFLLTAASLAHARFMLAGLVVHEPRMLEKLALTQGLIVAEAVMMAAAPKLGRQRAHDVVYDACRKAIEGGGQLADILAGIPDIAEALGGQDAIRRHCDPANYLGLCGPMVDRVLAMSAANAARDG